MKSFCITCMKEKEIIEARHSYTNKEEHIVVGQCSSCRTKLKRILVIEDTTDTFK